MHTLGFKIKGTAFFCAIFYGCTVFGTSVFGYPEPTSDDWHNAMNTLRSLSGVKLAMILFFTGQILFLLCRTMMGNLLGIYRLLVLALLSLFVTIGANLMMGKSILESVVMDGGSLMAFQVLFHQIIKQWEKRKYDRDNLIRARAARSGVRSEDESSIKRIKRRFSRSSSRNRL